MPFLDWFRKVNGKGAIARAVRRRHKAEAPEESLVDFANEMEPRGEVMVAAKTLSRYSDPFYGQWLVLHVPFRDLDRDLWQANLDMVTVELHMFALCLNHRPSFWRNLNALRAELELGAYKDHHVECIAAMVAAHTELVDEFWSGSLSTADFRRWVAWVPPAPRPPPALDHEQSDVTNLIVAQTEAAVRKAWAEGDDEDADEPEPRYPVAALGPAGSGKSTAVQRARMGSPLY